MRHRSSLCMFGLVLRAGGVKRSWGTLMDKGAAGSVCFGLGAGER